MAGDQRFNIPMRCSSCTGVILLLISIVCQVFFTNAQNPSTSTLVTTTNFPTGSTAGLAGVNSTTSALGISSSSNVTGSSAPAASDKELFQGSHQTMVNLSQCDGLFAFERTLDSAVSPALILNEANRTRITLSPATGNASSPVEALVFPCSKQCQDAEHCLAYISDYNNERCLLLYQRPRNSRAELLPLAGLAYYEKMCLRIPKDMHCTKEWAFERVVGMELQNYDDMIVHNVANRQECMSACLLEQSFLCRSAEYNYQSQDCRLSRHSRRTDPSAFHASTEQVDYLENQCAPEPQLCEYRAVDERMFSVEQELQNVANMATCQQYCQSAANFTCRSYRYEEGTRRCWLSADDRISVKSATNEFLQGQSQLIGFMERAECVDISMSCGPVSMTASLKLNRPFNGRFYPADKPNQCVVVGNNDFEVQLAMSLEGDECGTRSLGNGTFINDVVVQMHPIVLRDSDRRVRIACDYPSSKVTLTDDLMVDGVPPRMLNPNQPNITQTVSGIAALPKVRLQIRNGSGKEVQGAQLGDSLILSIDMVDEQSAFGIAASDLVAMSGSADETLQLLDGRGCPVEPSIFPSLGKIRDGHSLTSRFAAFKFASDSIVKFRVTVSFCLDNCPMPDCSPAGSLVRRRRSTSTGHNGNSSTSAVEERELTMELAILVDTESSHAPTIGKDGVVNEVQAARFRSVVCTKSAIIWGLGISAAIIQVITLSCCLASMAMYRRVKRQKGHIFESPSSAMHSTLAWTQPPAAATNPDLYRMYQ